MKIKVICLLWILFMLVATSGAQPVTKIAAGDEHSLFLKSDNSLWAMGWNYYGQLGDTNYNIFFYNGSNRPEQIVTNGIIEITGGYGHSLFLKNDGSLWAMGYNFYGQLGDGTTVLRTIPKQIVPSGVTAIAAGTYHSLFLKSDGSLWVMGYNGQGQLGDSNYYGFQTNKPEQIVASGVTTIAAGTQHSLFLKSDGSLWAMGMNLSGQLGDGSYCTNAPYGTNQPEQIVPSGVTAIAAGANHSLFIKNDGSLWAMGANGFGELGNGTSNYQTNRPVQIVSSGVIAIAAGNEHSLFLKNDGSLWGIGLNNFGQLGDATTNYISHPKQIVASNVTAIAAGKYHSLFAKSDGSLWAMGWNDYGQLGDGTTNNINHSEQIIGGYDEISGQLLSGNRISLSFVGVAGAKYALDRSFNLSPPNWIPQVTNLADANGNLVFTNTPDTTTNNFWRIRSVP
jgi:alpha-tubulin suppressor-like RCC1 family protein